MKKPIFLISILGILVFGSMVLGAENSEYRPKILPDNPLYRLKEWRRGMSSFFILDKTVKIKIELKFLNEKAAELKVLGEKTGVDSKSFEKSLTGYNESLKGLLKRLAALKGPSGEEQLTETVNNFFSSFLIHEEIFLGLIEKNQSWSPFIDLARGNLARAGAVILNSVGPFEFGSQFEAAVALSRSPLREILAVSFLDNLEAGLSGEPKFAIAELKEDLIFKFEGRFKAEVSGNFLAVLDDFFTPTPEKLIILDEVRERVTDNGLKSSLNLIRQNSLRSASGESFIEAQDVLEALAAAKMAVGGLKTEISSPESSNSQSVRNVLEIADFHLEQAEKFYAAGDYGPALGQATAAEAEAKQGLSEILKNDEEIKDDNLSLRVEFDNLIAKAKAKNLTRENNPKLYELFNKAEKAVVSADTASEVKAAKVMLAEIEALIEAAQ